NLKAARELLSKIRMPLPLRLEFVIPNAPDTELSSQIIREQWRTHLDIELVINSVDFQTWLDVSHTGRFPHLVYSGSAGSYVDPAWFLDLFSDRADGYGTHWNDLEYKTMLAEAKTRPDPALRLTGLAQCERYLLQAMPILPMDHWVNSELRKPFVRGLGENLLDRQ